MADLAVMEKYEGNCLVDVPLVVVEDEILQSWTYRSDKVKNIDHKSAKHVCILTLWVPIDQKKCVRAAAHLSKY